MIPRLPSGYTHPLLTGEGAFSSVYRVRQSSLDRWVAMKIITERDRSRRSELLLEAKTQANIHLDCIPQIYDTFEWDKRICIVMQWLKGVSLKELLDNSVSLQNRYFIAFHLIDTIASLHELGFAHRDLKPENVFISPQNGLYLVDFGFTKSISDIRKSMSGIIKGTPAYMAPELWNVNATINPLKTDLYALGKILMDIFPHENNLHETIRHLLNDNPDNRPESARLFFDTWTSITPQVSGTTNWVQIADSLSREQHSRKLFAAARELLYANRFDESYWLLVECLEEDPEYADAIDLMGKFPKTLKNSRKKIYSVAAVIISILIALFAFFAGKLAQKNTFLQKNSPISLTNKSDNLIEMPRESRNTEIIRFMQDTLGSAKFTGHVFISNTPEKCTISIDNSIIDKLSDRKGIELTYGEHSLYVKDSAGHTVMKEKFRLLPFQKKYLYIKKRIN